MTAYIIRRLLLMIPTLFGIMLVSFVVVQFAPGGPVERVIAQLSGADTGATSRISGSPAGDFGARGQPGSDVRRRQQPISRRAGARSGIHQEPGEAVRLRQAGVRALLPDAVELRPVRFRQELFPRHQRAAADQGEAAGLDLARPLDDAAHLSDLDPARHPQGGAGRLAVRRVDLGRRSSSAMRSRASCSRSCSSSCSPAARSGTSFRCAASPRTTGRSCPGRRKDRRLFLAPGAADHLDGACAPSPP